MSDEKKGKLIALEGPDGCGKSTQKTLLAEWLKSEGYSVKTTAEPTDNQIGQIIRHALNGNLDISLETEALLFASDRAQHVYDFIQPNLEKGNIVITGRYIYSSLAYQTSRGLPKKWVECINRPAIEPDITIFIDIPPEVGKERTNSTNKPDEFEKDVELQKKVRRTYIELAKEKGSPVIDGTKSKEKIHEEIVEKIKRILQSE